MMDQAIQVLVARLLAHRYVERTDPVAKRALVDPAFREAVEARLSEVGLVLLENPYAPYIAVALKKELEEFVFATDEGWLSNNMGLPRDAIALLVILWALIILPKRERQIARNEKEAVEQIDMFGADVSPVPAEISPSISEEAVYADFGKQLGGKMRFTTNLGQLTRLGFITRRNKVIQEGPLLDLMLDYATLAPRIIEGALKQVLAQHAKEEQDVSDS
jgi:hypothetical protein